MKKTFEQYELPEKLIKALAKIDFYEPTEIQSKIIPLAMEGHNIMACSETGSGKTGAFLIPTLAEVLLYPQVNIIILSPTRELAKQIADFYIKLAKPFNSVTHALLVGGTDMQRQINMIRRKPRVVIATPGRLMDHVRRGTLKLSKFNRVVLDEGDRMLDMGFEPQIREVFAKLPRVRQSFLFTATLPKKVMALADTYIPQSKLVVIGERSQPTKNVQQKILELDHKDKNTKLLDELNEREGSVIVFCKTKYQTDIVNEYLRDYGLESQSIHGGKTQGQRNKAIRNFKEGKVRVLCATDVAARGIDVPEVKHVINYDIPMMVEDYVHRIGRTARNGATGEALTFVTRGDLRDWIKIVKKYKLEGVDPKAEIPKRSSGGGRNKRRGSGGGGARRFSSGNGGNGGGGRRFSSDRSSERSSDRRDNGGGNGEGRYSSGNGGGGGRRFNSERSSDRRDNGGGNGEGRYSSGNGNRGGGGGRFSSERSSDRRDNAGGNGEGRYSSGRGRSSDSSGSKSGGKPGVKSKRGFTEKSGKKSSASRKKFLGKKKSTRK